MQFLRFMPEWPDVAERDAQDQGVARFGLLRRAIGSPSL